MRPGSTASAASSVGSERYNLRRTVTRIRRERQQRRRTPFSNLPEDSESVASSSSGINQVHPSPAPTSNTTENMANNFMEETAAREARPYATGPLGREEMGTRRPRQEHEEDDTDESRAQRPRVENGDLLRRLNLGADGQDDGQSIFFTFPYSNRHQVLVRIRHVGGQLAVPEQPVMATGNIDGILQWTLFFLMPHSGGASPENLEGTLNIDATQVLLEAFAAFNVLISGTEFSFEELTRLQEMMGFVSRGVPSDKINEQIRIIKFATSMEGATGGPNCSICLSAFEPDESCRRLPCRHFYHSECIDKWLNQVNQCPLCRKEAISKDVPPMTPEPVPSFAVPPSDLD